MLRASGAAAEAHDDQVGGGSESNCHRKQEMAFLPVDEPSAEVEEDASTLATASHGVLSEQHAIPTPTRVVLHM
jgi:hypothetical protein